MQTLLWYRFQTIWKQMKVVFICMGVLAGAVLLFALIGGAAAWEAGSFFFDRWRSRKKIQICC